MKAKIRDQRSGVNGQGSVKSGSSLITHHSLLNAHSHAPRPSPLAPAFTLIELMVVIGIIGLLITIAVPAFTSIRKAAAKTATAATINAINIGIEGYRTDSKLGEQYPPSYGILDANPDGVLNPHPPAPAVIPWVGGAHLLAWALAGADLLGTPGFSNKDAVPDAGFNYGGWTSDTGHGAGKLYEVNGGQPVQTRYGPYVDISKMSFPKWDTSGKFVPEKLDAKPQLDSICFLDSFHQPILYYKANIGKPSIVDDEPDPTANVGIYNLNDNAKITGSDISNAPGLDFGAGEIASNQYHSIRALNSTAVNPSLPATPHPKVTSADKGTFAYTVWNQNVTAVDKPHREDSFILLSAGPDGLFGTGDDIGNFPIND